MTRNYDNGLINTGVISVLATIVLEKTMDPQLSGSVLMYSIN